MFGSRENLKLGPGAILITELRFNIFTNCKTEGSVSILVKYVDKKSI